MPEPEVFSEQDKARLMANRDDYIWQELQRRAGRDKARMWAGEDWQLPPFRSRSLGARFVRALRSLIAPHR